jgi:hypothetical protein
MGGFRFGRPSPALVIAMIALVVALGGTAYAAFTVPKNSVGSKQLEKNAVTGGNIKNGAVTDSKIAKGTITGDRIKTATLGTVPFANHANSANSATTASAAGNASTLGGLAASAFLGAGNVRADGFASSQTVPGFTSSSFTSIAAKSFTAPTSGFVLISATLSTEAANALGGIGFLAYELSLDGTPLETNGAAHAISTDTANHTEAGSGAITEVLPITAGPHTVNLLAREAANGDYIESRQISVLFVPNGSASSVPFSRRSQANTN